MMGTGFCREPLDDLVDVGTQAPQEIRELRDETRLEQPGGGACGCGCGCGCTCGYVAIRLVIVAVWVLQHQQPRQHCQHWV